MDCPPLVDGHALGVTGPFVTLTVLMPSAALYTGPLTTCHSVPENLPLVWPRSPPARSRSRRCSDNELILQSSPQASGSEQPLLPLSWRACRQVPGAKRRGHTELVPSAQPSPGNQEH